MHHRSAVLEMLRWGYASVPGVIFYYAKELDLEIEDIGVLAAVFFTLERSKPLYDSGIKIGQILQACPFLTKQKLSRKLGRLCKLEIIEIGNTDKSFVDREIYLEPLMEKVLAFIIRDHIDLVRSRGGDRAKGAEDLLEEFRGKIEQLKLELEEEKNKQKNLDIFKSSNKKFKKVADFISQKTGSLLSLKMANELKKWLEEMAFSPEFLLCMLELCFERSIYNPADITKIAKDIKEYAINSVEGLEMYFSQYVDSQKGTVLRFKQFDPDIAEFGTFTGIDMNADARKKVYYKWRYDWGFSHAMIMKAGEVMCQKTKNGGLEYIDSVLNNWMLKKIYQVQEAEKEISEFKAKNRREKAKISGSKNNAVRSESEEYELYIPPTSSDDLKSNV
ncbi:MAG: DnaD domain protein [Syntrophomonadaceae bacterium]|nr:DnaD domain protein [Syntrophomonadaceae bacterium]